MSKLDVFNSDVFRNEYLNWVNNKMMLSDIGKGIVRIDVPFLDHLSDQMVMYALQQSDGSIILTDDGWTIDNLESVGVSISRSSKRKNLLNQQLKTFGVNNDDGELWIKTTLSESPEKKHQLLQAMLFVNDMFMLAPKTNTSIFLEDMDAFLDDNNIRFMENALYTGESGLMHKFEYSIAGNRQVPNKLIKTMSAPNNTMFAESIVTSIVETRPVTSRPTNFFVFMKDKKDNEIINLNDNILNLFKNNKITPVPFSKRNDYIKTLSE